MDNAQEQLARLKDMIASAQAGTWEWNVQTGELRVNEVWANLIGYSLAELEPINIRTFVKFAHPEDVQRTNALFDQVFANQDETYRNDLRMRHKSGHWIWVRDTGRVYSRTADGQPEWVIGMHVDISDTKQIEQQVLAQQVTLERAQEIGQLGYWTATPKVEELFWSAKIYKILGLDELTTSPSVEGFRELVYPDDQPKFDREMARLVKEKSFDFEHRIIRADGTIVWVHERATVSELNGREMFIGTMQNISATKQIEMRLTELSQTDELTKIYNRRYLMQRLREVVSVANREHSVLALLDIDFFKPINDTHGHDAGDDVLIRFAQYLRDNIRTSDVVARTGGEEFVILMFETDVNQALPLLNDLMQGIRQLPIHVNGQQLSITTTMGVTEILPADNDINEILIRADRALYQGKNDGRDRIVVAE